MDSQIAAANLRPHDAPDYQVCCVICCYTLERLKATRSAIDSVFEQSFWVSEVIVVVDHNDVLLATLRMEFPQARVVPNQNASGLSGARNTGISHSISAYIVFLDDDALADKDMVAHMVVGMQNVHVLGVGASIQPAWYGKPPAWFPDEFLWVVGCTYLGMNAGPVRNLIGAAMCMKREVFDAIGGFDSGLGRTGSGLPLGNEETELCIRANKRFPASRFVFVEQSSCHHAVSGARESWRYFMSRCLAEGLSKARMTAALRQTATLITERHYVLRVLPRGVLLGLARFFMRGDLAGLGKAGAILLGFTTVTMAYVYGRVILSLTSHSSRRLMSAQKVER